jgi:Ca2+-binding RTX toxin-like protein
VTLTGADSAQPTFTAPSGPATLTFELTVSDGQGGSDADSVSVTVAAPPNVAPVADAGADQDAEDGDTVTLDGTGSSDPDSDPLGYSWVQTGGPAVTLTGADSAQPTFTAPSGPASLTFELTVSDGQGTDTDAVTITVAAPAEVPTLAVTVDHDCLPDGAARLGLRAVAEEGTSYRVSSNNRSVLPASRVELIGAGGADPSLFLDVRPAPSASGVAVLRVSATNAAGTAWVRVRVVIGTNRANTLNGSAQTDVILARGGADNVNGRGGRDLLCGGAGGDRMAGGAGDDVIFGETGNDVLRGAAGDDRLVGGAGNDRLFGGPGSNQLIQR